MITTHIIDISCFTQREQKKRYFCKCSWRADRWREQAFRRVGPPASRRQRWRHTTSDCRRASAARRSRCWTEPEVRIGHVTRPRRGCKCLDCRGPTWPNAPRGSGPPHRSAQPTCPRRSPDRGSSARNLRNDITREMTDSKSDNGK